MRKFVVPLLFLVPLVGGLAIEGQPHKPTVVASAVASAAPKADAPTLTLPKTKTAKPNRYFCIRAATNCTSIKWIVPAGLEQLDPEIAIKDKFAIVLIGTDGTYTVQAIGTLGDVLTDFASCEVTIGTPPPPAPPTPPTPPVPPNPLTAALQAAYNADTDSDKATSLAFLQEVYAGMAPLAATWTDVKTCADALAKLKLVVESSAGLKPTQLVNLRKAIGADFAAKFGTNGSAAIDLKALAAELTVVGAALKGVK